MVEHAVAKLAIGGEASVINVIDVVAGEGVAALIGALLLTARFVLAPIGQQFVADVAVFGHPHAHIGLLIERLCGYFGSEFW